MGKRRPAKGVFLSQHSRKHQILPVLVWLGTVLCVIGLFYQRSQQVQVLGLAQGLTHHVAATCTGRIKQLHVGLYDSVEAGQVLVAIDTQSEEDRIHNALLTKELTAEQETLRASIEHLRAQRITKEQQLVDDVLNAQTRRSVNERTFSVAVESAKMRLLELERQLLSENAGNETLAEKITTLSLLVSKKAIAPFELEQAQNEQARQTNRIALYTRLHQEAEKYYYEALQRQADFLALYQQHSESPLSSTEDVAELTKRIQVVAQKELDVQIQRMAEIQQRLKNLTQDHIVELRAPFNGIVSRLSFGLGEVVNAEAPILQLAQRHPTEVIAFVPENLASRIKPGMQVEVIRNSHPLQVAKNCKVTAVGPLIEQLPSQLWLHPSNPQWGRSFLIQVPADLNLLVGERVGIREL